MKGVVEKLQKVGLTEYEAKAYMGLLNAHLTTATKKLVTNSWITPF